MKSRLRMVASLVLLGVAIWATWSTVQGLAERRRIRIELAEISHARYGMMNADYWVSVLTPVLEKRIDTLDLQPATGPGLKPAVENALYRLLDDVKVSMTAKPPEGKQSSPFGGMLSAGNPIIVNMIVGALRPNVPQYADMVLKQLGGPEARNAVKAFLRAALVDGMKSTFGSVNMDWYNYILQKHGCKDGSSCRQVIAGEIHAMDAAIHYRYLAVLLASGVAFLLLLVGVPALRPASILILLAFCMVLLAGGLLTPMLEVEAKISQLKMSFLGQPIVFTDQVLYFQSKSVLEVFRSLMDTDRPDMWAVGILVLMFSVVFPGLKLLATIFGLIQPPLLRDNFLVRFFALESSKWSMADVMALAIFMAFVAFNGLIGNTLSYLKYSGADAVIPTDSSKILPGYYLFIGFCVASLFVSRRLAAGIKNSLPA